MSKWLRAMGAGSRAGPGTSSNSSSVASVPHVPRGGCKGAHGGGPRRLRLARQEKKPREGEEIAPLFAERLQIVGPGVELLRGERLLATHELEEQPHDAVAVGVLAQPRVDNRIAHHLLDPKAPCQARPKRPRQARVGAMDLPRAHDARPSRAIAGVPP